jgi:hypothetical protein
VILLKIVVLKVTDIAFLLDTIFGVLLAIKLVIPSVRDATESLDGYLHFSLPSMNRLHQTEAAHFQFCLVGFYFRNLYLSLFFIFRMYPKKLLHSSSKKLTRQQALKCLKYEYIKT